MGVIGSVIANIFAVVNGGMLDLADGGVNFVDGALLFVINVLTGTDLTELGPRVAQVGVESLWAIGLLRRHRLLLYQLESLPGGFLLT
jgi:hypothetical protein